MRRECDLSQGSRRRAQRRQRSRAKGAARQADNDGHHALSGHDGGKQTFLCVTSGEVNKRVLRKKARKPDVWHSDQYRNPVDIPHRAGALARENEIVRTAQPKRQTESTHSKFKLLSAIRGSGGGGGGAPC